MKKRILFCGLIGIVLLSVVTVTLILLHFRAGGDDALTTADFDLLLQQTSETPDTTWTQDMTDVSIGNYLDSTEMTTTTESTTVILPTGRQFCVISAPFADTWSGLAGDDTFTPMCTTLVQGTVDYITGQSRVYDEEENRIPAFDNAYEPGSFECLFGFG